MLEIARNILMGQVGGKVSKEIAGGKKSQKFAGGKKVSKILQGEFSPYIGGKKNTV